jgi:hypothetical protein
MLDSRDISFCCSPLRAALPLLINELEGELTVGVSIKIIQTARDAEYQAFLYASGRTRSGPIVTEADGIHTLSNHQIQLQHGENACHAADLGIFDGNGTYLGTCDDYGLFKDVAPKYGLVSGWTFPRIDEDHIQCAGQLSSTPPASTV